ncbi:MAG: glycoside hydrolase family 32 protein, partial [Balneolaceae bacterium]
MKPQYSQSLLFSLLCMMLFSGCDSYNPFQQYQEEHRPQYHFTTPTGWLGVPAGMVYFKGRYHIFYQQNGSEEKPGKMNWGHATSKDLVYWEHFSAALHDEEKSLLPGSVVVDWDNSSGFGSGTDPVMVAIYTASQNENQELHLAFSDDEGRSWERFEGNPVLDNNIHQLTDPNVFWHHESGKWVMVAATEREQKIQIYTSENLKEWERMDEYESGSELNGNWQNPGMFQLPVDGNSSNVKWVLHMSTGNGTSSGRAGTQYVIGDFNGERFNVDSEFKDEVRWMDSGPDFFAPKTFTNIPGSDNRRILMAWMNNGDYAEDISTKPWRNSLTLPREMMLKTIDEEVKLVQLPVVELRTLRTNRLIFRNRTINEERN